MNKFLSCGIFLLLCLIIGSNSFAFEPRRTECLAPAKVGGGLDLTCRLVAQALLDANLIDMPMKITFKLGGIGAVAYNYIVGVRNSDPQVIVAASSGSSLNIATKKFGNYDIDAVRWLGALGTDYGVIAVRYDAPWQDLDELVATLRYDPQGVIIGGGGSVGSQDWMKAALISKAAGVDPKLIRYVAFEGGAPAANALYNGYIQVFPGDASELKEYIKAKKVRILAVLTEQRLPNEFAEIPTAREQGYPVDWTIWRGYYMGPKVNDDAYNWWVNTFRRLVKTEEFQLQRKLLGLYPFALFGQEFDEFVKANVTRQRQLAIDIGLIDE